jgi:predicted ATPase
VPAWQVLRPSAVASRFEALRGSALTPLIGRRGNRPAVAPLGSCQDRRRPGRADLRRARHRQVALIAELEERLHAEPYIRLRYFCSPYHRDSALYPFVDQLGRESGFVPDDPPAARLKKLEALLARSRRAAGRGCGIPSRSAVIAGFGAAPAAEPQPARKKERTLEALIQQAESLACQQPVLMVFEDAHWIDPTSRELLDLTIERVRNLPVLLIVTFRPEFQPPWTGQPQVTMITLNRLDRRDRSALVTQIASGEALSDAVVEQIVERTDGVPLFIEELTKSVLESGVPLVGIPTTLHDSLMARLDRLASVRLVAQIGAAIGRQFSYVLLRAVSDLRK